MLHMNKTPSPPKPSRVSVPVSAEVLHAFQRLAKAGNMSTGRAMAEWLADTVEGATYMAATMERARTAPKAVMSELHSYAQSMSDETGALLKKVSELGKSDKQASGAQPPPAGAITNPPPCNTGGKVSKTSTPKNSKGGV